MILINKEKINENSLKASYLGEQLEEEKIFRKMIYKTDWRKFQSLTLKISTSNQIPTNLISFDGYTWIQKYVWKLCSSKNLDI